MDDLQHYRVKIGLFVGGQSISQAYQFCQGVKQTKCSSVIFCFSVLMLAASGFVFDAMLMDPGIEWNPGPGIKYESMSEKAMVDSIKNQNKIIARMASHKFFLSSCKELGITPRGLDMKISLAATQGTEKLEEEIKKIALNNSMDVLHAILSHYNLCLSDLHKKVELDMIKLNNMSSEHRFSFLKDHINAVYESYLQVLQTGKMKKISTYLNINDIDHTTKWIPELGLTEVEKMFIVNNNQLCDQIMNAVMSLVMRDNPMINIQSTSLPAELLEYSPFESIHIHHNGNGHFVTSTSIGGTVRLFDSLNMAPSTELLKQITAIYSPNINITPQVFQCHMVHQQSGE